MYSFYNTTQGNVLRELMSCFERGSRIETIASNTKSALLPKCHAGLLKRTHGT